MMPLCRCCFARPITCSIYSASHGMLHLCNPCFLKLRTVLTSEEGERRQAEARAQCEVDMLEQWAVLEGSVNR